MAALQVIALGVWISEASFKVEKGIEGEEK